MSRRSQRRKQRKLLRKTIPSKIALIEDFVRQYAPVFVADGFDAPYVAASYLLVEHFVSKPVADEIWGEATGVMTAADGARITTFGETLFQLRSTPGLIEFCSRLRKKRPLSSFFPEVLAARIFLEAGFRIRALQECGVKGFDFDFHARKSGESVCVEVTTINTSRPSEKTIKNTLNAEYKQLPRNKANVIVCIVPETWHISDETTPLLHRQARRLFGVSSRINAVVFISEQHNAVTLSEEEYGTLQYRFNVAMNERARNPCSVLRFLWEMTGDDIATSGALDEFSSQEAAHYGLRGERPFFRWVDDLIGRRAPEVTTNLPCPP